MLGWTTRIGLAAALAAGSWRCRQHYEQAEYSEDGHSRDKLAQGRQPQPATEQDDQNGEAVGADEGARLEPGRVGEDHTGRIPGEAGEHAVARSHR